MGTVFLILSPQTFVHSQREVLLVTDNRLLLELQEKPHTKSCTCPSSPSSPSLSQTPVVTAQELQPRLQQLVVLMAEHLVARVPVVTAAVSPVAVMALLLLLRPQPAVTVVE